MTIEDAEAQPFWRRKSLEEMNASEWESLCDGCARCCLVKLEDEDTGDIHFTDIGCTLLDAEACRCRDYKRRSSRVPDCVKLTPEAVRTLSWLPVTCAYRLVAEGKDSSTGIRWSRDRPTASMRQACPCAGGSSPARTILPRNCWPRPDRQMAKPAPRKALASTQPRRHAHRAARRARPFSRDVQRHVH